MLSFTDIDSEGHVGAVAVAHDCSSSYLGNGNWKDCSLRPTWAKAWDPIWKNNFKQEGLEM
jgi:hypothetical protein